MINLFIVLLLPLKIEQPLLNRSSSHVNIRKHAGMCAVAVIEGSLQVGLWLLGAIP